MTRPHAFKLNTIVAELKLQNIRVCNQAADMIMDLNADYETLQAAFEAADSMMRKAHTDHSAAERALASKTIKLEQVTRERDAYKDAITELLSKLKTMNGTEDIVKKLQETLS